MVTSALVEGVAEYLADAGVAEWNPTGGYPPDAAGIFIAAVPASPDRAVTITPYPVSIGYGTTDVTVGLQVRTRGTRDPRTLMSLRDAVFTALDGLSHRVLSGIHVAQIYWQSGAVLGLDANERGEHTDNYYVQTAWPSPHRPE
ncbi:minor capsid protein [Stackebrandtia soli]|uniref:minor capsid protein n=1 Tax=Stackebrandtia soli TaxID=1892856 RepID=UPI0039ED648F